MPSPRKRRPYPVLAIIRYFVKFIKKEHLALSRYEKSHPHFLWYLGLDAVLSTLLVFGAFQLSTSNTSTRLKTMMGHSGLVAMTPVELIDHVKREHVDAFWLGPIPAFKYAVNHQVPGIADIYYLPEGSDANPELAPYKMETYKNLKVWQSHTHPLSVTSGVVTIAAENDRSITVNPDSMKEEIVTFGDRSEIVEIVYSRPQTRQTMIEKAQDLKPIR